VETYIILCNFERAELTGLLEDPTTEATARALLEDDAVGGSLEDMWLTTGAYDLVAVISAPDVRKALTFLAAFGSVSNVQTTTLTAVPLDGIGPVFAEARGLRTRIGRTRIGGDET
jgi:uncharacterized protein with GYD domain